MGSNLTQISATKGLLKASRFLEMEEAIKLEAKDLKWNDFWTVKEVRKAYSFRRICEIMQIRLIYDGGELFSVDLDGAYGSAFLIPMAETVAPYANDGEISVRVGNSPLLTTVSFQDGSVTVTQRETEFKAVPKETEPPRMIKHRRGDPMEVWEVENNIRVARSDGDREDIFRHIEKIPLQYYDKDDMKAIMDAGSDEEAIELYWRMDTNPRDWFGCLIIESWYGTEDAFDHAYEEAVEGRLEERYQEAVDAIGGQYVLDHLPKYFKDGLKRQRWKNDKIKVLQAIAELKELVTTGIQDTEETGHR